MKKANNFQRVKVQPQGVAQLLLIFFCKFQPGVAYKCVAYIKKCVLKKILKPFATLNSIETRFTIITKVVFFSLDFVSSERNDLSVPENFLLSTISLSQSLVKYFFFFFFRKKPSNVFLFSMCIRFVQCDFAILLSLALQLQSILCSLAVSCYHKGIQLFEESGDLELLRISYMFFI